MKLLKIFGLMMFAGATAVANDQAGQEPPAIPDTPAAVDELVYARPFTLDESYPFEWQKDSVAVTHGYLLVLKVDADLVYPRNAAEPVLYVGHQAAERVNHGHPSGYVIAVLPGDADLSEAMMWFGDPDLPGLVDASMRQTQREKAADAGIKSFSEKQVKAALAKGGDTLKAVDRDALQTAAARLIVQYAPDEKFRVLMRLPVDER
jgi:hypothetical protein